MKFIVWLVSLLLLFPVLGVAIERLLSERPMGPTWIFLGASLVLTATSVLLWRGAIDSLSD
jgi:hypothetical protein